MSNPKVWTAAEIRFWEDERVVCVLVQLLRGGLSEHLLFLLQQISYQSNAALFAMQRIRLSDVLEDVIVRALREDVVNQRRVELCLNTLLNLTALFGAGADERFYREVLEFVSGRPAYCLYRVNVVFQKLLRNVYFDFSDQFVQEILVYLCGAPVFEDETGYQTVKLICLIIAEKQIPVSRDVFLYLVQTEGQMGDAFECIRHFGRSFSWEEVFENGDQLFTEDILNRICDPTAEKSGHGYMIWFVMDLDPPLFERMLTCNAVQRHLVYRARQLTGKHEAALEETHAYEELFERIQSNAAFQGFETMLRMTPLFRAFSASHVD